MRTHLIIFTGDSIDPFTGSDRYCLPLHLNGFRGAGLQDKPIPATPQFTPTNATAINKKGEAIGEGKTPDGATVLYKYSKGKVTRLPNDEGMRLSDLNENGDVLGYQQSGDDHVIWHADGTREQFSPGPKGALSALNTAQQMVGSLSAQNWAQAAMYANGEWTVLKTGKAYEASWAVDINDASAILIEKNLLSGEVGREVSILENGKKTRIGLALGENHWNYAVAINAKGHAIGMTEMRGFIYNGVKSKHLPTLDGAEISPLALNNLDEVIGKTQGDSTLTIGDKSMHFESTLDTSGADWTELSAYGINDRGEIVGAGKFKGALRAFIATRLSQ